MSIYSAPAPISSQGVSGSVGSSMMGPLIPLAIQGGLSLFGSLFGAKKQSDASKYAARLDAQAQAQQLAFLREAAQHEWANNEVTRRGNYDQWRARENRLAGLWNARGWGDRGIPDYVPGVDPGFVPKAKPGASSLYPRMPQRTVGSYF